MEVIIINRKKDTSLNGYFIHVNEREAISLIRSLSEQLERRNPNCGRVESRTKDGKYFSIGVDFSKE